MGLSAPQRAEDERQDPTETGRLDASRGNGLAAAEPRDAYGKRPQPGYALRGHEPGHARRYTRRHVIFDGIVLGRGRSAVQAPTVLAPEHSDGIPGPDRSAA